MNFVIKVLKEVNIVTLYVNAKVRYWEDATINGKEDESGDSVPCKVGEYWKPVIDIETGVIENWDKGTEASIHFKVCDEGEYYLRDESGEVVLSIEEGYVPSLLSPNGEGYGDYIIMSIDGDGKIKEWVADISDFLQDELS